MGETNMQLTITEQHYQIEQVKTDHHIKKLLVGIKCFGTLYNMSEDLLEKHKAKNPTINNKLMKFKQDWLESYDDVTDEFLDAAIKEISVFCGFDEDNAFVNDMLFSYGNGDINIDSLLEKLKWYADESLKLMHGK
jgi:hypothetical protein